MPIDATPLYRPEVIHPRVRAFTLPDHVSEARNRLVRWVDLLEGPKGGKLKESELLPDFLTDVFQVVLGYRGPAGAADGMFTISREKLVEVDGKFADAVLGLFGTGQDEFMVALEGKGPKDPLDRPHAGRRMSAVDQAYRYAINLPCDWILVTNLREIRLYHKGSTQRCYERFVLKEVAQDEAEFRRFVFLLGAERVVPHGRRSHLYELLESSEQAGEDLTQEFYRAYADIRHDLLDALLEDNPEIPPADVLQAAQRLLDRTLFVAFAEDRGLLPAEMLKAAYEHRDPYHPRPIWANFQGLFRSIDQGNDSLGVPRYNGGLFAEHEILDNRIVVPDEACELLKRLGDYEYGTLIHDEGDGGSRLVDVEILGHIFEQSIEDLEAIRSDLEGGEEVSRASSRRKREGAFYTPRFVTRYIVEGALTPVLRERFERLRAEHEAQATGTAPAVLSDPRAYDLDALNRPQRRALVAFWESWVEELKTVRALDPACGSGAFLIELFDQLHAEYQQVADRLVDLREGDFAGSLFDPDRTILEHNLYGVDVNEEAIEIARLSIWIKTAKRGKVLSDLDHNIRVGNSLVSDPDVDPRAFNWWAAFPEAEAQRGFDVVVGNPPYVRAEKLRHLKSYLKDHYDSYHGSADLYVYFFELGGNLLRPGGRLSYIVTNKWMKARYGVPLRAYLAEKVWTEEVVDLGHAKGVFPDADVFPSILRFQRPTEDEGPETARACVIPRDEVEMSDLSVQIRTRGFVFPRRDLGGSAWTLDPPAVADLMAKIEGAGVRLEALGDDGPYRGVVTGCNDAFLIDQGTRDRLVAAHPGGQDIIRPFLRGRDIDRWQSTWSEEWMIFARRGIDIEKYPAVLTHLERYRERLEPKPKGWSGGKWPGRKSGSYEWYEIQDAVDYHEEFLKPKVIWKDLSYHSSFAYDTEGFLTNDLCFILPTDDLWVLGVLNSPLMWAYLWRRTIHGKDEVLRLKSVYMRKVPIAPPADKQRGIAERSVHELVRIARRRTDAIREMLDWLRVEFGVLKPGRKLESFHDLDPDTFVAEVKKRRDGPARVSAAELRRLRQEFDNATGPMRESTRESLRLEAEVSRIVIEAYGLTAEEEELLWRTAPPRMPTVAGVEELVATDAA